MEFKARSISELASATTQCLILPVFEAPQLPSRVSALAAVESAVARLWQLKDFTGKVGTTALLTGSAKAKRLLLVGVGPRGECTRENLRSLLASAARQAAGTQAGDALFDLGDLPLNDDELRWLCRELATQFTTQQYRYATTVSKPTPESKLLKLVVSAGALNVRSAQTALDQGSAIGLGINTARELGNLPANICTPTHLANEAKALARKHSTLRVQVIEENKMRELGMGALLSVTAGSEEPAKLIVLNYRKGPKDESPFVLVGKGITFDTGGISLKPGAKMDEMKFDMCGAASVLGTFAALAALDLPLNVTGIIAACENMPSGRATKPGDVVTSMSGQTIEVLNTDAEGRLVLCDALTYAERLKPRAVIDIATLTGACVVALGDQASGLYANDDELAAQLLDAGTETHDRAWRMPLWKEYNKQLETPFADVANIGGPGAGSITAACFLARFATNFRWAHLDIAGSAWSSSPKAASGRPVALLTRYLMHRAGR